MHAPIIELKRPQSRACQDPLVSAYRETSRFFFASQEETLLAHGDQQHEYVSCPSDATLASFARDRLQRLDRATGGSARLALALPFRPTDAATGWLLSKVDSAHGRQSAPLSERASLETHGAYSVNFQPTPRKYVEAVSSALRSIDDGKLSKVVLGRILELSFAERVDSAEWLRRFYAQNASGYVFSIDLSAPSKPMHKLMGASPELLLRKRGGHVYTNPLAGSRARGRSTVEDEENARALLQSEKDHREHALVIESVVAALRPFCVGLEVPARPSLLSTPTMWHLSTAINGQLRDPGCSSIELVQALHPTPAVAGYPREPAVALIAELEGDTRGPFAGAVGHCNAQGDGEWAVTLRCAQVTETSARLFAGAGVVAGSDPWAELDETGAKFRTALRALGVPLLSGGR